MGRRSRSEIIQLLKTSQPWAEVLVEAIESSKATVYILRKKAIDMYVDGEDVDLIYSSTGLCRSELHRLIDRCTKIGGNGIAFGYRALIPQIGVAGYTRKSPVKSRLPESKVGYAGALQQIFRKQPGLQKFLEDKIFKVNKKKEIHEHAIKARALHKHFTNFLKEMDHPVDEWPFNTVHQGYRSIARFLENCLTQNFDNAVLLRGNDHAQAHLAVGSGKDSLLKIDDLLSAVEIDSHKIDAEFVIGIANPEGLLSYITTKRLNILALVERASTAVLWYLVVYSAEVSASDVVRLITESLRAELPKPCNNLLGLTLPSGGGYPAEQIPAMKHALPSTLMPDNALSNLAGAVSQELRKKLGFSICYGSPGHFEMRPNVERAFRNIATSIFQRLPNTTGATPQEGKQSSKNAIKYEMESDVIEEIVYFHFAQSNSMPSEGISYLSPLEFIRQKLALNNGHALVRTLPQHRVDSITHFRVIKQLVVRCYKDRGVRPFVQLDRVRYSNDILRHSAWLNGKKIFVHIDEQDMRVVTAYYPDGSLLGPLRASGPWAYTRHSKKTRQAINKLVSDRILCFVESDDPVHKYMEYLAAKANGKRKSSGSIPASSFATEFLRVDTEVNTDSFPTLREIATEEGHRVSAPTEAVALPKHENLMPTAMPNLRKLLSR